MNRTLRQEDPPIRCNRGMKKKTWEQKGINYASDLTLKNFRDLKAILEWNIEKDIYFYRCTSELVPWNSQFELKMLPDYDDIERIAKTCGSLIKDNDMRFTFHPDYWCKLASKSKDTVDNSVRTIENHADWMKLLGLETTPYYSINVHIGAHYGNKDKTAERFRKVIRGLSSRARGHLTVENDDKESLWGVPELVREVGEPLDVPIVFDYHHHKFTSRGLSYRDAFELSSKTWGPIRPIAHYSESARLHKNSSNPRSHSEYVYDIPSWLLEKADVMIEAGEKEQALLRFRG